MKYVFLFIVTNTCNFDINKRPSLKIPKSVEVNRLCQNLALKKFDQSCVRLAIW